LILFQLTFSDQTLYVKMFKVPIR